MNPPVSSKKFHYLSGDRPLADFVIQRGVGIGGFGEVYFATTESGKEVALKRIQRNLDIELRGVQQCLNLRHPNLVELYDVRNDAQDNPWVVMQFIGGDSLRDVIRRNPAGLPDSVIRHWFKGIAAGVIYLHDNDVVHRDLKPGNIFLDNGVVKIGDYGLAKMISDSQGSGQTESVGTFHYMAPEIGRGKYGRRIDIYALGIVLHEMVTGEVPFNGESSQEIIMKHLTSEPDLSGISEPYRTTIRRALAKDPDRRYSTVEAMLADLELDTSYYEMDRARTDDDTASLDTAIPVTSLAVTADRPIVSAEPVDANQNSILSEEPISQNLYLTLQQVRRNWEDASFNTPTKFIFLVIVVLLFVLNAKWIVPTAFFASTVYVGYLMFWMLLAPEPNPLETDSRDELAETVAMKPADNQLALRKQFAYGKATLSREIFGMRNLGVRVQELIGSMLLSTLVVGVLSILMLVVGSAGVEASPYSWAPMLAWTGATSLIGTWMMLVYGKFVETQDGDPVLRRFAMLVIGMLLGFVATWLSNWLLVDLTYLISTRSEFSANSSMLYLANGMPRLWAALGYFGGLMILLRWWRLFDPLRPSRLSMLTTAGCVATAILIHFVLPYPRGFLIAATIAMAVQISAPWLSPSQRQKLVSVGAPLVPATDEED